MRAARATLIAITFGAAFGQSTSERPAFEVASVKPDNTAAPPSAGPAPGGVRFVARNMPLNWLIGEAYYVSTSQISGLPEELSSARYDIEAKADRPVNRDQMRRMLRTLLEDRFRMSVRRETRELKARVLVVARGGPKLDENRDGGELAIRKISGNKTSYHNMPMSFFANLLSGAVDEPVVDQTGLSGSYDFTLDYYYARDHVGQGVLEGREPAPDPNGASLYTALEQQLGLKLESRKERVQFLVIDHIQKPSGN
jgi:uncharacterized protein (TIGR03435 family)